MKLNPALIVLVILMGLTFAFLWAITPQSTARKNVISTPTHLHNPNQSSVKSLTTLTVAQKSRIAEYAQEWAKTPSYEADFNALDPSYNVASLSNSLFDPTDDYWGLPRDDKGSFELVDAYCSACHSLSIVMQQRATPERWQELLTWMEEKQGMAKIPSEDEALVLEYISAHFSTQHTE